MYESANLGSNSWRRLKKVYECNPSRYVGILPPRNSTCSSCEIIQRYDDPNIIMVHCRLKLFISYNGIYDNYKMHLLKDPGHKQVPCMDSTNKFRFAFVPGTKGFYKDCEWLKRFSVLERRHKCKKFRELKIRCPVSCETFKCKLM